MSKAKFPKIINEPTEYKTLEYLSNPHARVGYRNQLLASKAIDLQDNVRIVELADGWIKIEPIDPNKLFGE